MVVLNNGLSTGTFQIQQNKLVVTHEPSAAAASQLKLPPTPYRQKKFSYGTEVSVHSRNHLASQISS